MTETTAALQPGTGATASGPTGPPVPSSALHTDHYELTMLQAALHDGVAHHRAAFEVFARKLPLGRQYGVFGGLGRLLDALDAFRFDRDTLAWLRHAGFLDEVTLRWLERFRFSGTITAYREGELYFPSSPVLTVESTFGEAVLLETIVLSVVNHDSAVASAAARMVDAADGRLLIEMGSRRTHEEAAVAAARMAHLVGFAATSNLEAGRRYGIPTAGTAAHAFTLAHTGEPAAFASQLAALGVGTTLLVDTYDTEEGVRTAVRLANAAGATGPGGIRIDSGDLAAEAFAARSLLDGLGATDTRIIASSDLDEYLIEELVAVGAPIDAFGVGTRAVTGSGHPTAGFIYKLVAVADSADPDAPLRPVAKRSAFKVGVGGRKRAWRLLDDEGYACEELVVAGNGAPTTACGDVDGSGGPPGDGRRGRALQVAVVVDGRRCHLPDHDEVRRHHRSALAELRPLRRNTAAGPPALLAHP